MRLHERTTDSTSRRVWGWVILMAALLPSAVIAQDQGDRASSNSSAEPVDLAADSIRAWKVGADRWLLLQGRVAIIQGLEGVRAERAVIRISQVKTQAGAMDRLDVYAEGQAQPIGRPVRPRPDYRATMATTKEIRAKPYANKSVVHETGVPKGLAIFDRAFPGARLVETTQRAVLPGQTPPNARAQRTQARPEPASNPVEPVREPLPELGQVPEAAPKPKPDRKPEPEPSRAPAESVSVPEIPVEVAAAPPKSDRDLVPTQFEPEGFNGGEPGETMPTPELEDAPSVPNLSPMPFDSPTNLDPLPDADLTPEPAPGTSAEGTAREQPRGEGPSIPVLPGTQRKTRIYSRDGGPFTTQSLPDAEGFHTVVIRGGVNIVIESPAPVGVLDLSADRVIIWRRTDAKMTTGPNGEKLENPNDPMEIYLEGHVVLLQDTREVAGNGDNKTYIGDKVYYDLRTGRAIVLEAELNMFAPGLIAPTKLFSPRIEQYRPLVPVPGKNGVFEYGLEEIHAEKTMMTGSRFPVPGYRFNSRSVDISHVVSSKTDPNSGESEGNPHDIRSEPDLTWRIDARRNVFYLGALPVFFWPRILGDADDIEPPLRQIRYGYNNYFGHQILSDFNGFRLFGIRRPQWIDNWNIDIDYLSMRTTQFPALGTEIGWFGKDFLSDLFDPYRRNKRITDNESPDGYFGYLDMWGLIDNGIDVLGTGPAIVTPNGDIRLPDGSIPGKRGFQRGISGIPGLPNGVPAFQKFRGRVNLRHMQSLLGADADPYEDFRIQVEAAYVSDRQFLEEYYKRLSETGLDQETLAYLVRQKDNWAWSIWAEANLQNFNTETQWLPRLDYYRLGDSPLFNWFTYDQHTGINYANVHTAVEVNNPNIFAFIPYDPISNTSGAFQSGRVFTNHELDLPLNFGNILRVVPYVQGQAVGWDNQISGNAVGRIWGAAGARADIMAWKRYPDIESDLLNIHGLNHKINFQADYRNGYSNVKLNEIGVQDDLDDNTYEFVRRYFALYEYHGGVLPPQYDPRHLILRRGLSPITGPTDIQGTQQTLQLNLHSRLQTKRGPEGRRRIMDFMTLDLSTTFFPYAQRDNFGKAFGQNTYNWQWFLGDRTSLVSYGWFEFFDITGRPTNKTTSQLVNDPFGLNVITSGISISRPPRGNIFIGYTILDSGQITTSALNPSISYWMSPKWYGTFSNSYDFGNEKWLSAMFSFTRVGADYLTTIGLTVDPQRNAYAQIAIAISPRLSPGIRLGSGSGLSQFDSRYAPTQ